LHSPDDFVDHPTPLMIPDRYTADTRSVVVLVAR
jgi:hypothetical protein